MYRVGRDTAGVALATQANYEIETASDYIQALSMTKVAAKNYDLAPSGSILESIFKGVYRLGWTITAQKFTKFLNFQLHDFRAVDNLFKQFYIEYDRAQSGSNQETFYKSGYHQIEVREIALFNDQVNFMNYTELSAVYQ